MKSDLVLFQEFSFDDKKMGSVIEIKRTPNYSILEINGRSYYFHPETGEFDGVSSDVSQGH